MKFTKTSIAIVAMATAITFLGAIISVEAAEPRKCLDTDNKGQMLQVGGVYNVTASWYGPGMKKQKDTDGQMRELTATGRTFNMYEVFIAHKNLPFYSVVDLHNTQNGKTVRVEVIDDGPHIEGREVDATKGLAQKLDFIGAGTAELTMTIVSMPDDKHCRVPKKKRAEFKEEIEALRTLHN